MKPVKDLTIEECGAILITAKMGTAKYPRKYLDAVQRKEAEHDR